MNESDLPVNVDTSVIVLCEPARVSTRGEKTRHAAIEWLAANSFVVKSSVIIDHDSVRLTRAFAGIPDTVRLIVVCGSTGIGERDIAPRALEQLCEFPVPGIGEMLRAMSLKFSLNSALSRCGGYVSRGRFVLSVPGSSKAALEQLEIMKDLLPHAVKAAGGKCADRRPPK